MNRSAHKGAKFRCYDCQKEWVVPKDNLVHIQDWPTKCPHCESVRIGYQGAGTVMASIGILQDVSEKELEKIQ